MKTSNNVRRLRMQHKFNHEDIDVKPEKRLKIIRQDRIDVYSYDCYVLIDDIKYKIINLTPFGIAVEAAGSLPLDKSDVPLYFESYEVGRLHLKAVRHEPVEASQLKFAYEIIGEPLRTESINAIKAGKELVESLKSDLSLFSQISPEFKNKTLEVKRIIETAKQKIEDLEKSKPTMSSYESKDFDDTFCQIIAEYFDKVMSPFYMDLAKTLKNKSSSDVKKCFEFFRNEVGNSIFEAPFANRVYHKPLGYAGDYEMMNIIYRQEAEGKNLYAKCLHKYFIEKPAAAAVRNRATYLNGRIKKAIREHKSDDPIRILSVASGPAKEIQHFLADGDIGDKKIEFHLIDQDMDSLKHAQRQLYTLAKHNKNIEFHFHNTAIKNIIARGLGLKGFDLIYSAGLFDYFSEPVAQLAGQKIFEGLRVGGQLIIGNFNVENPNQFEMDLALDWRLIYRSKDDMKQLFGHLPGDMAMETENLNINLFFTITRTE